MRRVNHIFHRIADMDNLRVAFWKAARGKSDRTAVIDYRRDLEQYLLNLRTMLLSSDSPVIGRYHYFTIFDPKERIICAADFPERVLHHAIMNVCEPVFESSHIFDTYACRKGKGSLRAVHRAREFAGKNRFFLKMDIRKYYDSIDHQILWHLLSRKFKDTRLLNLFAHLLDTYETDFGKGLPIGNLTSQHFGNFYLGNLDHFIKESLRQKFYVRYMDDFVVWSDSKVELKDLLQRISAYLSKELRLALKPGTLLNRTHHGCDFLGYRVFPGKLRLTQRSKRRFIRKFKEHQDDFVENRLDEGGLQQRVTALFSFVMHANTRELRKKVLERYTIVDV